MTIVKIRVTQGDINDGETCDALHCPLAEAMSRALDRVVSVGCSVWCFVGDGGELLQPMYSLPAEANRFAAEFDRREKVAPFEFDLSLNPYMEA